MGSYCAYVPSRSVPRSAPVRAAPGTRGLLTRRRLKLRTAPHHLNEFIILHENRFGDVMLVSRFEVFLVQVNVSLDSIVFCISRRQSIFAMHSFRTLPCWLSFNNFEMFKRLVSFAMRSFTESFFARADVDFEEFFRVHSPHRPHFRLQPLTASACWTGSESVVWTCSFSLSDKRRTKSLDVGDASRCPAPSRGDTGLLDAALRCPLLRSEEAMFVALLKERFNAANRDNFTWPSCG